ncbi:MAG: hypothetical protein RRC34_02935 [Lentisphaeria bacterium]|nr:hypothetical protein [Lentisphaeria bacterium]
MTHSRVTLAWHYCLAIILSIPALGDAYDLQPPSGAPYFVSAALDAGADAAWLGFAWTDQPGWAALPDDMTIPDPAAGTTPLLGDAAGTTDYWLASGTANEYYYSAAIADPDVVYASLSTGGYNLTAGTAGALSALQYAIADNDAIGEDRLYVRLTGDIDPDTLGYGGIRTTVEADDLAPSAVWNFNELSGNQHTDNTTGIAWTGVDTVAGEPGIWDYAVRLPQGAYMTAPHAAAMDTSSVAVSMWILVEDDINAATASAATLLGRSGLNAPWSIIILPADIDNPYASLSLRVRTAAGTTNERMIGLEKLYPGAWNHVMFSYDAATGAYAAYLRGQVVYHDTITPGDLLTDTGGMVAGADNFSWQCTELLVSPVSLDAAAADINWRRGACGTRVQVSLDDGATWTDNNGVAGAYIYDQSVDMRLDSLSQTMRYKIEIWSWDSLRTPRAHSFTATYGEYPQGAFVIPVDPAAFGPGMPGSLTETYGAANAGYARYRVSPDNALWYYYNAANDRWELAVSTTYSAATTNSAAEMTANLAAFPADVPAAEAAYVQIFLVSGKLNQVSLDTVAMTYVAGSVAVTAPDGDTAAEYGDDLDITWTPSGTYSGNWDLYYSVDDGASWETIITSQTGTSYTWTIPADAESAQARVRVADHASPLLAARSAQFIVQRPALIWSYPVEDQRLLAGVETTLQWTVRAGVTPSAACVLEYSANGVTWTPIDTVDGATLTYDWTPPAENADITIRLRDPDSNDVAAVDVRLDAGFLIAVSPKIYASAYAVISWDASPGTPGMVDLAYSVNAGLSWTYIDRVASTSDEANTYTWRVPNTPAAVVVRVSAGEYSDQAAATLSGVTITAPLSGAVITDQSAAVIGWRSYGAGETVAIQYATSDSLALEPAVWITLATAAPNTDGLNTYTWPVDTMPTTRARLRVVSNTDIHLSKISDEFTIEVAP